MNLDGILRNKVGHHDLMPPIVLVQPEQYVVVQIPLLFALQILFSHVRQNFRGKSPSGTAPPLQTPLTVWKLSQKYGGETRQVIVWSSHKS